MYLLEDEVSFISFTYFPQFLGFSIILGFSTLLADFTLRKVLAGNSLYLLGHSQVDGSLSAFLRTLQQKSENKTKRLEYQDKLWVE